MILSRLKEQACLNDAAPTLHEIITLLDNLGEQDTLLLEYILETRRNRELCAEHGCPETHATFCGRCGEIF